MRSISPPPPRLRPAQRNQAITPSRQTPRRDQPTDTSAATSTDGVGRPVQPTDTASIGAEGIYRYPPELPPAGPAPRWPRTGRKGGNHQMRGTSPDSAPRGLLHRWRTRSWQAEVMRRRVRVPAPRSSFAGFRFPPDVILVAVRWYLRYGLSYRDVEELLAERGIAVDHVSIFRWVQRFT